MSQATSHGGLHLLPEIAYCRLEFSHCCNGLGKCCKRGGDVDLLLISPNAIPLLACAELKMALEQRLQLPFDIVTYVTTAEPTPFQAIALAQSRPMTLEVAA